MRWIDRTMPFTRLKLLRSLIVGCGVCLAASFAFGATENATALKNKESPSNSKKLKSSNHSNVPFELKGVQIGDGPEKIAKDFNIECQGSACMTLHNGDRSNIKSIPDDKKSFAGYQVSSYTFQFADRRLGIITAKFYSGAFGSALEALSAKYGKPSFFNKTTLQNNYGATVSGKEAWWTKKDEAIVLTQYSGDPETGSVQLLSKEYLDGLQKEKVKQARTPGNI
ncbi:hypothetical protein [Pseudomonas sp.]|mgnify:FL=1|jgi:hypothetical protein|uniref:hypothetical protein n=1 Tax=Pseudomonas sp. TaxID=306 RepID=UPI003FD77C76